MPSPTYQCTKARLAYIKSNLWSRRAQASAMEVVLLNMHTARLTGANCAPWATVGGWQLMPTLKPVGDQSTNCTVFLALMRPMAWLTSFGTTSPRYKRQQAIYLPWRGSHLTIWFFGSKHEVVISCTLKDSWRILS